MRHEIISNLIPVFLGNHVNAAVILHSAWNHQVLNIYYFVIFILLDKIIFIYLQNPALKRTIVQAMSDWYIRSDYDHVKLSRILDIAQDLKVCTSILISIFKLLIYLYLIIGIISYIECSAFSVDYRFSLFSISTRIFKIR